MWPHWIRNSGKHPPSVSRGRAKGDNRARINPPLIGAMAGRTGSAGAGIRTRVIGLEGRSPDQLDYACLAERPTRGAA